MLINNNLIKFLNKNIAEKFTNTKHYGETIVFQGNFLI